MTGPAGAARAISLLQEALVCPVCQGGLAFRTTSITCLKCSSQFSIDNGLPVLLCAQCPAGHDELHHMVSEDKKDQQARFFNVAAAEEFEISRPNGTPELYRWLISEKLRRAISPIAGSIKGQLVLSVCAGSGMDAEFLARSGAAVIAADISVGAAKRALKRAERYTLDVVSIVADVERLPFRDRSIPVVFVHDGLHHLADPFAGLAEMTRVAAQAVVITEPSKAGLTALAIRLGLASEFEEAGNRVGRLRLNELRRVLTSSGFDIMRAERYAMYYPHQPGRGFELLSQPFLLPLVRVAYNLGNLFLGRFGNKVTVTATRRREGTAANNDC